MDDIPFVFCQEVATAVEAKGGSAAVDGAFAIGCHGAKDVSLAFEEFSHLQSVANRNGVS